MCESHGLNPIGKALVNISWNGGFFKIWSLQACEITIVGASQTYKNDLSKIPLK